MHNVKKKHLQLHTTLITTLFNANKIKFGKSLDTIYLCLVSDSGNDITKLGLFIVNVKKANNPSNITLLGLYNGKNLAENLLLCFMPNMNLEKLKKFKIVVSEVNKIFKTEVLISGDKMFLCAYSTIYRRQQKIYNVNQHTLRTIESMKENNNNIIQIKRSQKLDINLKNVVSSILHILIGIIVDAFTTLLNIAKKCEAVSIIEKKKQILKHHIINKKE